MEYSKNNSRIVYMGTPEISAVALRGLIDEGFNIVAVITNPDKPVGRKGILTPSPVKEVALAHGIPVFQPAKIRLDYEFLKELKPDVIVTLAYGQIVPQGVLDIPVRGCVNLHGSLLPELRGAAPIQRAIDLGKSLTGITLMEMVAAMDAGKMFDKIEVSISSEDNYTSLCDKLALAAKELILKDLLSYLNGLLPGIPQDESQVTFAAKITPEDERLDFSWNSERLLNRIRALSYTPGGYGLLNGEKFKIFKAHAVAMAKGKPGEIVCAKKGVFVSTADGVLSLDEVQLQGKKMTDGKSFANGYRDLEGRLLA